ncbi:helix-turn-helix domain-containing protein [Halorhabdus sp. CUG00001]|uniref:helix-turn-helix domain-containing protein n=1 Tax=Halorhabdus sp. CUG00001 TaxID=2600297 RepID=UPI00131DCFB0|nr:helix-turn-helix domain-containing protein [Halorhabdus sp. CUG00001]
MIACCTFAAPVLEATFSTCPDLYLEVEGMDAGASVPLRLVFWARGATAETLDDALADDRTVADATQLASMDDAILYRSIHGADLPTTAVYNAALSHDAVLLAATNDGDGWDVRMRVPDRDALSGFLDQCNQLGVDVAVNSIRDQDQMSRYGFGLTPSQREILALAWDRGYFSVPRETSLGDLAADLDISQQAASERLRRGLWQLVSNTVCEREPATACQNS